MPRKKRSENKLYANDEFRRVVPVKFETWRRMTVLSAKLDISLQAATEMVFTKAMEQLRFIEEEEE